jgi:hypothetical protein
VQAEPIIVLPYLSINILIDGCFYGVLSMRSPESGATKLQLLLASDRLLHLPFGLLDNPENRDHPDQLGALGEYRLIWQSYEHRRKYHDFLERYRWQKSSA